VSWAGEQVGVQIHIVVITGLSGSGKSTAIRALEDIGFYCIDNLPVVLLPKFLELAMQARTPTPRVGLVIDAREGEFLHTAEATFREVRQEGHKLDIVFLEADVESLVRRYSETRRKHPMAQHGTVLEGIEVEMAALTDLRHLADLSLDTSAMTPHALRQTIQHRFSGHAPQERHLTVNLVSFGFRHGVPMGADLVFDVRFLRNPYFVHELRPQSGRDPQVADYVLSQPHAQTFLGHLYGLLDFALPLYQAEGKTYLTIAIGCTGGHHRSVAVVEELKHHLSRLPYHINLHHRDLDPP
jgi:UPF0042 nucleotide-binding protein